MKQGWAVGEKWDVNVGPASLSWTDILKKYFEKYLLKNSLWEIQFKKSEMSTLVSASVSWTEADIELLLLSLTLLTATLVQEKMMRNEARFSRKVRCERWSSRHTATVSVTDTTDCHSCQLNRGRHTLLQIQLQLLQFKQLLLLTLTL